MLAEKLTKFQIEEMITLAKNQIKLCEEAKLNPEADIKMWDESISYWQDAIEYWNNKLSEVENV